VTPARVGIVADDLTGAGDIGAMFAKAGYAVRILSADADWQRLSAAERTLRTDVAIIDTDSRYDAPSVAREKVRRATLALKAWGANRFIKKTCSVFRGNIGVEFDALMDVVEATFGVAVAAFPKNGRATVGGIHYVHGKPLAESEFAHDPVNPRHESNLVVELQRQTRRKVASLPLGEVRDGQVSRSLEALRLEGVTYALCDIHTQDDLRMLAEAVKDDRVVLGSSALAEELAPLWPTPPEFSPLKDLELPPDGGVLVAAGSVMPQTQRQMAVLSSAGVPAYELRTQPALDTAEEEIRRALQVVVPELRANHTVAVKLQNTPEAVSSAHALGAQRGLHPVEVSRHLSEVLAAVVRRAVDASGCMRVVALGGDTSAAVCRALDVEETLILEELAPGLPSSLAHKSRPLLLVLKSGSFGEPAFALSAVEHLRALSSPTPR